MKKLALLLLITLTAVPLARANSVNYDTGIFMSGIFGGSFMAGGMLNASITGSLHTIDITTGPLTPFTINCPKHSSCFSFTSGSVTVSLGSTVLFHDTLSGGLTLDNHGVGSINAILTNAGGITAGTATAVFDIDHKLLSSGSEDVAFNRITVTPEPASLFLFGSGLLGLIATKKYIFKGGL
jgi:hypothetical protein